MLLTHASHGAGRHCVVAAPSSACCVRRIGWFCLFVVVGVGVCLSAFHFRWRRTVSGARCLVFSVLLGVSSFCSAERRCVCVCRYSVDSLSILCRYSVHYSLPPPYRLAHGVLQHRRSSVSHIIRVLTVEVSFVHPPPHDVAVCAQRPLTLWRSHRL